MANTIKLKRGTSTPTTSDIVDGEVAIDKSAQKLYVNDGGSIKEIGGSSGSSTTINNNANNRVITGSDTANTLEGESSLTYDGAGNLSLSSTDAGSTANPILALDRNSSSPADNDVLGDIHFKGRNSAGEEVTYGSFMTKIADASDGTEDGRLIYKTMKAGSLTTVLDIKADQLKVNNVSEVFFGDPVSSMIFEGATGNSTRTTVQVTDPTANRTVTIPDKSGTFMLDVADDSSPQLAGNLDVLANEITTTTTNGNIKLNPNGTGVVEVKGDGSSADGTLQLNCSQNSHGVKIKSPAHSAGASYTLTLPDDTGSANQVLKTDGSGALSWVDQSGGSSGVPATGGTFTGSVTFEDAINENVFAITDASSVALDPDNGMIQTWTLGANRTATDSLNAGQSVLLMITAGSYTLTWPTITWAGGSAPTLSTSSVTAIELWKVGTILYGANVGNL